MSTTTGQEPPVIPKAWYTCTCHCGATEFKILHANLDVTTLSAEDKNAVTSCNCSICVKNGYLLVYVLRTDFEFIRGWDDLKNYRFGSETREHKFCGVCGSSIGLDSHGLFKEVGDILGINARLIQGIDVDALKIRKSNGRVFQPQYNDKYV